MVASIARIQSPFHYITETHRSPVYFPFCGIIPKQYVISAVHSILSCGWVCLLLGYGKVIRFTGHFNIQLMSTLTASVVQWSEFLATDPEARVLFPALPEKKSSGSGTGSTQPREYNWRATWYKSSGSVGIRHAGHVAPSIRKSWQSLRRQAAVARSV
jgi:hypothetical protein